MSRMTTISNTGSKIVRVLCGDDVAIELPPGGAIEIVRAVDGRDSVVPPAVARDCESDYDSDDAASYPRRPVRDPPVKGTPQYEREKAYLDRELDEITAANRRADRFGAR